MHNSPSRRLRQAWRNTWILALLGVSFSLISQAKADSQNVIPDFKTFKEQLPAYSYECDVEKFLRKAKSKRDQIDAETGRPIGKKKVSILKHFSITEVPSNVEFNEQLALLIPQILHRNLSRLADLNPEYAESIYENLKVTSLKFKCSTLNAHFGIAGMASERFLSFGGDKKVDIGAATLAVLKKTSSYQKIHGETDNLNLNRILFHEILHHVGGAPGRMVFHRSNFRSDGGENDIVYACGNIALQSQQPLEPLAYHEALKTQPLAEFLIRYSSYFTPHRSLSARIDALEARLNFDRFDEIHNFTYEQCVACGQVRRQGRRLVLSSHPEVIERAQAYCERNALTLDRQYWWSREGIKEKIDMEMEIEKLKSLKAKEPNHKGPAPKRRMPNGD